MSERIMTLFGEEIIPEQPKAVGKGRAKKKANDDQADDTVPAENEGSDLPAGQGITEAPANENDIVVDEGPMLPFPSVDEAVTASVAADPGNTAVQDNTPETDVVPAPETAIIPEGAIAADVPPVAEPVAAPVKKQRAKPNEENIILPEDWQGDKKYYTIGEVAELFKVKTSHIRFWTNEFKLKVRTTRKGDRLFTPEQIRELRAIHHLVKERGFTLTGAKAKLKEQNNRDVHTIDLKTSLQQLRAKLVIIKNQLA